MDFCENFGTARCHFERELEIKVTLTQNST